MRAEHFLMVGNSLRSDILPVLELGGTAIHIPSATTWVLDRVSAEELAGKEFVQLAEIREIAAWLRSRKPAVDDLDGH